MKRFIKQTLSKFVTSGHEDQEVLRAFWHKNNDMA